MAARKKSVSFGGQMELHTDRAIVLRADAYAEADRIVTLFTASGGKQRALARRARSSQRRFAGLQPCMSGSVRVEHRRSGLHVLHEFVVDDGQLGLLSDLARLAHAAYVCELTELLTAEEASDPALHALLGATLSELATAPIAVERLRRFELRSLAILGFLPALDACVQCSKTLEVAAGWSATGVLCGDCAAEDRQVGLASLWTLQSDAPLPTLDGATRSLVRALLATWLRAPLGNRTLRSVAFIEEINR